MSLKNFLTTLSLALLVLTSSGEAPGQSNSDKHEVREAQIREETSKLRTEQRFNEMERLRRQATQPPTPAERLVKEKYKLNEKDKKLLAPAAEDRSAYAVFLGQPDTGLFRLLPYKVDNARTVSAAEPDKPQVLTNGVGALYSFSKRRYGYDKWSEILLQDGSLKAGVAAESLGLLIALGDVPLESLTHSSPGVAELSGFTPATDYASAVKQYVQSRNGLRIKNSVYRSTLPALVETTYALRSTSYGRSDVLILFRVIREEPDGGLTILWKKMGTYPAQTLKGKPED